MRVIQTAATNVGFDLIAGLNGFVFLLRIVAYFFGRAVDPFFGKIQIPRLIESAY